MKTGPPETADTPDVLVPAPLSRLEAMESAIRLAVILHLAVCVVTVFLLTVLIKELGVLWGFGVAAVMAMAIPFVVLPVAAAIGFLTHLVFHGTQIAIPVMIRTLVILFEVTLLIWMVVAAVLLAG